MNEYADRDFFTNKFTHLYLDDDIYDESVNKLIQDIRTANKTVEVNGVFTAPKPILIHINSPGGNINSGKRLMTVFAQSRVPIYTLVDGYSASAATFLSILSPNRLMTVESLCLIHQYWAFQYGKREELLFNMAELEKTWDDIIDMYKKKTKIPYNELKELLKHDLWLTSKECLEKGIVDRVLYLKNNPEKLLKDYTKKNPQYNINPSILLKKSNLNTYYTTCPPSITEFTNIINNDTDAKPLVLYTTSSYCDATQNTIVPFISRIKALNIPSYAVIETDLSLDMLLPYLYCSHVYIFEHVKVYCNFMYMRSTGLLLDDLVKNSKTEVNIYKKILKERTRLPIKLIDNIDKKIISLTPKDCVKYGIANSILPIMNIEEKTRKIYKKQINKKKTSYKKEEGNPI